MIVLVLNTVLTIAFVIALLWTVWGVHRLTQQIQRLNDETNKKDKQ